MFIVVTIDLNRPKKKNVPKYENNLVDYYIHH